MVWTLVNVQVTLSPAISVTVADLVVSEIGLPLVQAMEVTCHPLDMPSVITKVPGIKLVNCLERAGVPSSTKLNDPRSPAKANDAELVGLADFTIVRVARAGAGVVTEAHACAAPPAPSSTHAWLK